MKEAFRTIIAIVLMAFYIVGCEGDDPPVPIPNPDKAVAVTKSNTTKVYMHYMPWFETPASNDGSWGIHWTMDSKDPNLITDGQREIASHYYPLIGPYASGDKDVIEYHLLLMKYAGIDGVIIDWYGSYDLNDYDENLDNSEELIEMVDDVGLNFAVTYEDRTLENVVKAGLAESNAEAAGKDFQYLAGNYFKLNSYIMIDGNPLVCVFGPIVMENEADWTTVLGSIDYTPALLPLWYESSDMGDNANGEYAWVYQSNNHLEQFYDSRIESIDIAMGGAYPGFHDAYDEGGWGDGTGWIIDHMEGVTMETTLNMATEAGIGYLQLITWNDFGEGTMIEPTVEFGYTFLEKIQTFTGVSYTKNEFEYIRKQYDLRKSEPGNASLQRNLDVSFGKLIALKVDEAKVMLDSLEAIY